MKRAAAVRKVLNCRVCEEERAKAAACVCLKEAAGDPLLSAGNSRSSKTTSMPPDESP